MASFTFSNVLPQAGYHGKDVASPSRIWEAEHTEHPSVTCRSTT